MACDTEVVVTPIVPTVTNEVDETSVIVTPIEPEISVNQVDTQVTPLNEITEVALPIQQVTIETNSPQGPAGPTGPIGPPGVGNNLPSFSVMVAASATEEIDNIPFTTAVGAKWLVAIKDSTNDLIKNCEVHGNHRVSGTTFHTVFSVFGDAISTTFTLDNVSSSLSLKITNNSSEGIIVSGTRIAVFP